MAASSCADGIRSVAVRVRAASCGEAKLRLAMYPLWRCTIAFTLASKGAKSFTVKETEAVRAIMGAVGSGVGWLYAAAELNLGEPPRADPAGAVGASLSIGRS